MIRRNETSRVPSSSMPRDEYCDEEMIRTMKVLTVGCCRVVDFKRGDDDTFEVWVRGRGSTFQYVVRRSKDAVSRRTVFHTLSRYNDSPLVASTKHAIVESCKIDALTDAGEEARSDYDMIRRAENNAICRERRDRKPRVPDGHEYRRPYVYDDQDYSEEEDEDDESDSEEEEDTGNQYFTLWTGGAYLGQRDSRELQESMSAVKLSDSSESPVEGPSTRYGFASGGEATKPPEVRRDLKPKPREMEHCDSTTGYFCSDDSRLFLPEAPEVQRHLKPSAVAKTLSERGFRQRRQVISGEPREEEKEGPRSSDQAGSKYSYEPYGPNAETQGAGEQRGERRRAHGGHIDYEDYYGFKGYLPQRR